MTTAKVMGDRFKVSRLWATRLREHQVSVPAILRRAGLPAGFFQQEKIYVSTVELFAFWRTIGETSQDPTIGLKLGTEPPFELEAERKERDSGADLGDQVKRTLKRSLAGKRPTLPQVARELCMSARTLQRRLTEAEITFQQLVEDTRRELAHHYLKHSTVELNEAAFLRGYEDSNSFFRAFQIWEGTTPGEWRTRYRAAEPAAA